MNNIYRGELISKKGFINQLCKLKDHIEKDLLLDPLMPEVVIEAVHILANEINQQEVVQQLIEQGISKRAAEEFVKMTANNLQKNALIKKIQTELGENPFIWDRISEGIEEKYHPLGVIMHIGAGNTLGLSAYSVIEGLLTGNINILKLPENERGLSVQLLMRLIEIEPRLKPYIYVIDVSSKDQGVIFQLIEIADAVVVWGSDEAIQGIRQLVPPSLPIIEWGHRLSFAYFTQNQNLQKDLHGLAKDICLTDQLYCSSPQCVFYETNNPKELDEFATKLAEQVEDVGTTYPAGMRPMDIQASITWTHELIKMEEILNEKKLITNEKKQFSIMVDYHTELKASPLYRNIWVMPIKRKELLSLLRVGKGYMQTVGLSCKKEEFKELATIFYRAGINRITDCGNMSNTYIGEPHDGVYALQKYVRKVNNRRSGL